MSASLTRRHPLPVAVIGIGLIGWLDYLTGYELRMFPLYFGPVAYASASRGRDAGITLALLSAAIWWASNVLAGIRVSGPMLAINAGLHFATCAWIAVLIARLRAHAATERANARADALTGLPNQRALTERLTLEHTRLRRGAGPLVVACMDLDRFKEVNDRHGHAAGDLVLRSVAWLLRHNLREADVAARVGGDEFVILLPDTGHQEGRQVLERVRATIADYFREGEGITATIGAVVESVEQSSPADLIARADAALYDAKRAGRDRVEVRYLAALPSNREVPRV